MDAKELRELIDLISRSNFSTFELEREGLRLRLVKETAFAAVAPPAVAHVGVPVAATPVTSSAVVVDGAEGVGTGQSYDGLVELTSPIVGTFFRAPSPGAPVFVESGSRVRKGQVLCIIEAMKLMNEIESEIEAEVVEICVENGQPVEFGEVLFRLRPAG